jgi:hypothetical protein
MVIFKRELFCLCAVLQIRDVYPGSGIQKHEQKREQDLVARWANYGAAIGPILLGLGTTEANFLSSTLSHFVI